MEIWGGRSDQGSSPALSSAVLCPQPEAEAPGVGQVGAVVPRPHGAAEQEPRRSQL